MSVMINHIYGQSGGEPYRAAILVAHWQDQKTNTLTKVLFTIQRRRMNRKDIAFNDICVYAKVERPLYHVMKSQIN